MYISESAGEDELLAKMAIETGIPYKIKSGRLEKCRDTTYGKFVLKIEEEDKDKLLQYLEKNNLDYKILLGQQKEKK